MTPKEFFAKLKGREIKPVLEEKREILTAEQMGLIQAILPSYIVKTDEFSEIF